MESDYGAARPTMNAGPSRLFVNLSLWYMLHSYPLFFAGLHWPATVSDADPGLSNADHLPYIRCILYLVVFSILDHPCTSNPLSYHMNAKHVSQRSLLILLDFRPAVAVHPFSKVIMIGDTVAGLPAVYLSHSFPSKSIFTALS